MPRFKTLVMPENSRERKVCEVYFFFLNTLSTVQFEFISPHSLQQLAPEGTYVEKRGKFFTPNKTLEISGSEVFKVSE